MTQKKIQVKGFRLVFNWHVLLESLQIFSSTSQIDDFEWITALSLKDSSIKVLCTFDNPTWVTGTIKPAGIVVSSNN